MSGFDTMNFRERCSQVIIRASDELQEEYYTKAVKENFNSSWDEFKTFAVEFCTSSSIDDIRKYNDETWSQFMERIKLIDTHKGIDDDTLLQSLRNRALPQRVKMAMYSSEYSLNNLIKFEKKFELAESKHIKARLPEQDMKLNPPVRSHTKKEEEKKCFKCNEIGHISRKYRNLRGGYRGLVNRKTGGEIDERKIKINEKLNYIVFDTGSSINIIDKRFLKECTGNLETIEKQK